MHQLGIHFRLIRSSFIRIGQRVTSSRKILHFHRQLCIQKGAQILASIYQTCLNLFNFSNEALRLRVQANSFYQFYAFPASWTCFNYTIEALPAHKMPLPSTHQHSNHISIQFILIKLARSSGRKLSPLSLYNKLNTSFNNNPRQSRGPYTMWIFKG